MVENALLSCAVDKLAGCVIVLDEALQTVIVTPSAERVLGRVGLGVHVTKVFADEDGRAFADTIVAGRPAMATLEHFRTNHHGRLRVRATPVVVRDKRIGWVVVLAEEPDGVAQEECFHGLWSADPTMRRLFRMAERVAPLDVAVLIEGEMGTGKASLAWAIHTCSTRRAEPFRTLLGASATTDTLERRIQEGGTLFLDDVTALRPEVQGELVRVLEHVVMQANVRVISSSHVPLHDAIEGGRLRADLGYRLRVVTLCLPPLRARRGDIPLLLDRFIAELGGASKRRIERVDPAVRVRLEQHDWPGNVRELRAAIESAFAVGEGSVLSLADLPADLAAPFVSRPETAATTTPVPTERSEVAIIRRALERAAGDRARAASMLGMSRTTLWRRMRALSLLGGK